MIDRATMTRLNALARQRTPAVIAAQLAEQEAGFQREADWRKAESMRRIPGLVEARRRRGQGR